MTHLLSHLTQTSLHLQHIPHFTPRAPSKEERWLGLRMNCLASKANLNDNFDQWHHKWKWMRSHKLLLCLFLKITWTHKSLSYLFLRINVANSPASPAPWHQRRIASFFPVSPWGGNTDTATAGNIKNVAEIGIVTWLNTIYDWKLHWIHINEITPHYTYLHLMKSLPIIMTWMKPKQVQEMSVTLPPVPTDILSLVLSSN